MIYKSLPYDDRLKGLKSSPKTNNPQRLKLNPGTLWWMTEIKVRETINLELLKDSCLPHERKQNTIHNILRNWELSSEKTSQRTEEKESKARFNYDDLTTYRLFIRLNLTMLLHEVFLPLMRSLLIMRSKNHQSLLKNTSSLESGFVLYIQRL